MLYLQTRWFGVFLHDGEKLLDYVLFPRDRESLKERIEKIWRGEILEEEKRLIKNKKVISSDRRLTSISEYADNIPFLKIQPEDFGFDYNDLRKILLDIAGKKVDEELGREDLQIIQMVKNIDELVKISNILSERIREWKNLSIHHGIEIVEKLKREVDKSIEEIKSKLEEKMESVAPNLSNLLSPILGAELISLAGGLERLAKLPASSIQILGAEKALFRYKHGKGTPPKHGIIFRHHIVRSAKSKHRGKISRFLASKISMAAKADAFTGNIVYDELKREVEEFVSKVNREN